MSFPESIFPFPIFPPDHLRPSENMFTVKREADGAATPRWYRKYQIHISQMTDLSIYGTSSAIFHNKHHSQNVTSPAFSGYLMWLTPQVFFLPSAWKAMRNLVSSSSFFWGLFTFCLCLRPCIIFALRKRFSFHTRQKSALRARLRFARPNPGVLPDSW